MTTTSWFSPSWLGTFRLCRTGCGALTVGLLLITGRPVLAQSRIEEINFDMARVQTLWVSPGLATVIRFPCDISEAVIGRGEDLKAQVSPTTKRILSLYLTKRTSQATNLLVKCEISENFFVFDVLPSMTRHQDFLKVNSGFSGPLMHSKLTHRMDEEAKEDRKLLTVISKHQGKSGIETRDAGKAETRKENQLESLLEHETDKPL